MTQSDRREQLPPRVNTPSCRLRLTGLRLLRHVRIAVCSRRRMPSIFGKNFPNTPNNDIIVYVLLDFSISNYKCFAEEAQLSFVRPSLKTQVPRNGQSWADVTYQVAAVYGANASGKSTLLEVLAMLSTKLAGSGVRLF